MTLPTRSIFVWGHTMIVDPTPEFASLQSSSEHVSEVQYFFFCHSRIILQFFTSCYLSFAFLAQWSECWARDCLFCSKPCAFALVAKARQSFLNLRNPNHLFPRPMTDCLQEAKSLLQIVCANQSFFAKTVQLFTIPDAFQIEMRLQNRKSPRLKSDC